MSKPEKKRVSIQKQKSNTGPTTAAPAAAAAADEGTGTGNAAEDFEAWMKSRQLIKPDDQLELTEVELSEEIPKMLTPTNSNVIENLVVYNFKEGGFTPLPLEGSIVNIYDIEGACIPIDCEEARCQIEEYGIVGYTLPTPKFAKSLTLTEDHHGHQRHSAEDEEGGEGGEEGGEEAVPDALPEEVEEEDYMGEGEEEEEAPKEAPPPVVFVPRKRKLINQFNFCERAALTYTRPTRGVETQTIPPPRSVYGNNVLQWVIFDYYAEDFEKQQKEREKEKKHHVAKKVAKKDEHRETPAYLLNRKYLKCWQILERMINQNIYEDIASDYRYWEDPSDDFREGDGTLLPLWKFVFEKTKKMHVTDVLFNPLYYDLFAVCYGSRMFDGNVAVYDLMEPTNEPIYMSGCVDGKHPECISEIKWAPDMADGEINLFTASTGGQVYNWILMAHKFAITAMITLYLADSIVDGPDGTQVALKACASCMCFHPTKPDIYLIGTEEGLIFKCCTAYSSKYILTYNAHYLSVYRIDFNKFNPNIFASCSGDWRIKIWEDMRSEPLFIFDLGSCVGDVKWAPYSSTVFAAVTSEGKVYVFDINVNKYTPICIQAVVPRRKSKLTRIAFNQKLPFIIVGDDKGAVTSLKLSPNLRVMVKPPKKQQWMDQTTLQIQKLDKILSLVRELPSGTVVKETTTTAQS